MNLTRRRFGGIALSTVAASSVVNNKVFAQAAPTRLKFGIQFPAAHPAASRMVEACEEIKKETGGNIDIAVFPNTQLGGEAEMLNQLRSGAIEFMTTSGAVMQTLVPVAGINAVPFAFKDYSEVWAAMDGDLGAHVRSAVEPRGLYLFPRSLDNGFRNITTSTKPIEKVEDLQNLKIRVPPAPLWVSMFKALGASPTSISLAELYSALQTKIVDGQENPLVQIETVKIYEVQKYCSMTGHVWDGNWVAANGKRWSALPEDVRKLISARFDDAAVKQREDVARLNTELETSLKQKGLTFNYPDKAPFRDALTKAGFYAEWKQKYGAEPWSKLEKYAGPLGA